MVTKRDWTLIRERRCLNEETENKNKISYVYWDFLASSLYVHCFDFCNLFIVTEVTIELYKTLRFMSKQNGEFVKVEETSSVSLNLFLFYFVTE